ncbi:phosphoribosyltransferase domain-containing protein [Agromyces sp. NPDC057679]|uniref:phosphoribosyltransferase domain-containing protein n=1 Tax=Agromyces sp. NPDC057679 TaxID=3346207 RepID=UPI0036714EFC
MPITKIRPSGARTSHQGAKYVMGALGMSFSSAPQPLSFDAVTGIALRRNPRRAHLLTSKLLGKHYPQSPELIEAAAEVLAAKVWATVADADDTVPDAYAYRLAEALDGHGLAEKPAQDLRVFAESFAVLGFAEAATGLGACVASALGTYYVSTTRYPARGRAEYGSFQEEHSHAPSHYLTPADTAALRDGERALLLVDDELTTGRTAMNTIRMMHAQTQRSRYIIATLADLRDGASRAALPRFAEELGIELDVVSLFSGELVVPDGAVPEAQQIIAEIEDAASAPTHVRVTPASVAVTRHHIGAAHPRDGVADLTALDDFAASVAASIAPSIPAGPVLVLGIEEDMYAPLRAAVHLSKTHHGVVHFGATTRSPAVALDHPDYGIRDVISYEVPAESGDTEARFLYNIGDRYDSVIILTGNAAATDSLTSPANSLLSKLSSRTDRIHIIETQTARTAPTPLVGPAFGSYPADDVTWLLKDLSDVALEVTAEDREEAVQNGGMHYAEALPVEYVPTAAYQKLFDSTLASTKRKVALHVAVTAERIFAARSGRPVLVSLARAGTPVGVLIRRYLKQVHNVDAAHYAVSIVRGKGIDSNALAYIASRHDSRDVVFVDGWTGKGAISRELADAVAGFNARTGERFSAELAVLADPGRCAAIAGTREDYLIPSAALNSTVSGLVSRTVLRDDLIGPDDFHGAKFYRELRDSDVSSTFVDTISSEFDTVLIAVAQVTAEERAKVPNWTGWKTVQRLSDEYGIGSVNLVKPGVGETTRVLLRRVPWKVLVRDVNAPEVAHIILLAEDRGVPVEEVGDLPFTAVGLIHPKFTRGATGFDGKAA